MVGLGSWITFNVGNDPVARDSCAQVMGAFFNAGGRMIDCSPMYGFAQDVIGCGYWLRKTSMHYNTVGLHRSGAALDRRARHCA